jgi:ABC-type lipoprotein release transport system permease subunit
MKRRRSEWNSMTKRGVPMFRVTVAAVCALLALVAVAATLPPAWHAAHIDPIEALRAD